MRLLSFSLSLYFLCFFKKEQHLFGFLEALHM